MNVRNGLVPGLRRRVRIGSAAGTDVIETHRRVREAHEHDDLGRDGDGEDREQERAE